MKKFTLFVAILLGFLTNSNAQIGLLETFNASTTIPTGWTNPNFYAVSSAQSCNGNSVRKNLYSSATTAVLTTPNYPGASNGTDITFSFDYKIVNWSAATEATPAGWGSSIVEVSTDDGATWLPQYTIDDSNHVVANTCANVSFTIAAADAPAGSDLKFRFRNTWLAGDYYFYIDNISASQVTASPPNCDAALTSPADGASDANIFGNITWSAATGVATGYNLTVGTTPGGSDVLATTDVGNVGGYALGSLNFETTYYISIVPYNTNGNATGCTEYSFTTVPAPAPGNLCENPIVVTLPYETTDDTANYEDIYYEGSPGSSCGSTSSYLGGNDVVYAYTATADGSINVNLTTTETYVGLFAYASCSSIGSSCIGGAVNGFAGGPVSLMEFPVVSGQTYYFVISTWPAPQTAPYTLSIVENTCTNATATYTVVSDCANGEQFLVDVDVTSLGTATSLTVTDDQGSAPQTVSATGVVQFGPYQNATPVVFTVSNDQDSNCVITSPSTTQAVCPPANDLCSGAINLGLETSPLDGTTVGATNNNVPTCGGTTAAPDVYYSISVPSGSTLTIQQTANSYDSVVSMFYGDCSTPTAITCYDDSDTLTTTWANTTGSDQTVYFVVDGYAGTSGTFTLAWSVLACSNATATYTVVSDCANGEQFLVDVNITDLGTATSLTVSDDQGSATQSVSATGVVQFGPYPNATPVVFTVTNDQDSNCVITSSAQSQAVCPPDCSQATVVDCDTETVADFVAGSGAWNVNACGFSTPGIEKIYSFTAPADGSYSLEVTAATGGYVDYYYKEASGSCDNTGWTCIDDISLAVTATIGTLTSGTEYLILLDSEGTTARNQTFKVVCPVLATDTFDNANFKYNPNPVVDVLNLSYNKAITSIAVYNLIGQQVIAKTVNANMSQVDMSALPTGTYMVKVTSNNEVKTIKVVKQ
ncbi:T9SS type A sorting domain-containing protein [Flavobacterium sp.]|uniref:T9SS type A sorting domain-containing protein n=1 Tax=Flavobacterium sp. TaxID=239 RepID=UPI00260B99F2|nr:T9SS type A sorting domain-containing protein [Flavobacterium sp.]